MVQSIYLVLTTYFPSPNSWRCAYVYDQVRAIRRLRPRLRVVVVNLDAREDYRYQGIEVWGGFQRASFRGSSLFPRALACWNARRLCQCLRAHALDFDNVAVVHAHLPSVAALAVMGRVWFPNALLLAQLHHPEPFFSVGEGCGWAARYRFYRWVLEHVDGVVSISGRVTEVLQGGELGVWSSYPSFQRISHMLRRFRPIRPRDIYCLHNGVDVSMFCPDRSQRQREEFVVGCVGNFIDWKEQMTLLRAIRRLQGCLGKWRLRLVGSGPTLMECKAFAVREGLGDKVSFEPEVFHERLPDFYRGLDLFVLPSRTEAFGCVFTEAWACGTPFITCEGQGMDDFILPEERHLWLCKPGDDMDLAEKILVFFRNRPRQRLAAPIDIDVLVGEFLNALGQRVPALCE